MLSGKSIKSLLFGQSPETYPFPTMASYTLTSKQSGSCSAAYHASSTSVNTLTIARCMKLADFDILKLLGFGGSGKVYLVRDKLTSELLALKVITKQCHTPTSIENIMREQRIQSEVSESGEDFFPPLVASWHDEVNFYLAMTYFPGGDMAFEMMRCRKFEGPRARFYAAELIVALETLHNKNVIHRDVKPGNILFRADGHIVLGDFGFSEIFDFAQGKGGQGALVSDVSWMSFDVDNDSDSGSFLKPDRDEKPAYSTNKVCGTPYYMSPEQHYGEDYSFGVDFWGMGVTLYRMLTNRMPFGVDARDTNEMASSIASDALLFDVKDNIDSVTQDFLQAVLAKNPRDRPTLEEIKAHSYFNGIIWEKVAKRGIKAPWKPFILAVPNIARMDTEIAQGGSYDATNDPFPKFTFNSRTKIPAETTGVDYNKVALVGHKPFIRFLRNLFTKKSYSATSFGSAGHRPLLLPDMICRRPVRMQVLGVALAEKSVNHELKRQEIVFSQLPEKGTGMVGRVKLWVRKLWEPKRRLKLS